jgi:hypothetical protein
MGALVRAGFRGLGDSATPDYSMCDVDPTSCQIYSGGGSVESAVTPTSSGFNWGALTNVGTALTNDFTKIYSTIQPVPAGCVKQTGANGQSYIACGQPGATLGLPALTTGSNLTMLLLLGGGVLVVSLLARGRG